MNVEHPAIPHITASNDKTFLFQTAAGDLSSGMRANPAKTLSLIILVAALGVGCEKKENTDAGKPKLPLTQPKVVEKPNPTESKPRQPAEMPKPLPPSLVAAWEKAGFTAGWMGPRKKDGYVIFSRNLDELESSKAVAAFRASKFKPGVLESLPGPTKAFGLDLCRTQITDAGLKEVAKLQQLTSLDLHFCKKITDAGVAELKKALPKCEIDR